LGNKDYSKRIIAIIALNSFNTVMFISQTGLTYFYK
jgi:hypothetical protein